MKGKAGSKILSSPWYVTLVFFVFVVLHYADKFLISPLLTSIRDEFGLTYVQLGAIETGTILVAANIFQFSFGILHKAISRLGV